MAQFNYIVRTKDGIRQEGTIDADNINSSHLTTIYTEIRKKGRIKKEQKRKGKTYYLL